MSQEFKLVKREIRVKRNGCYTVAGKRYGRWYKEHTGRFYWEIHEFRPANKWNSKDRWEIRGSFDNRNLAVRRIKELRSQTIRQLCAKP